MNARVDQDPLTRVAFNLFPAYRGTGGWITYIARDWSEIRHPRARFRGEPATMSARSTAGACMEPSTRSS